MFAFLIAVVMAIIAAVCGWLLDVRLTGTQISPRVILSLVLIAVSIWLSTLILTSEAWVDDVHTQAVFRVFAMFAVLLSMLDAFAVAVFTVLALRVPDTKPQWRLCVIPLVALAAIGLALFLFDSRGFYPQV